MEVRTVKLTWGTTMTVWWSFVSRSVVYGFIGGAVLGAIAGFAAGATGHGSSAALWGGIAGYVAGLALSTLALKQALERNIQLLQIVASVPNA
jgi:outer membrane lipoprotein SlyB